LPSKKDHKRSFPDKSGKYQFHYMLKDGITYLCFATADKKTAVCFSFLDDVRLKFCGSFEEDVVAKAMAYSTTFLDFKRILKEEMIKWSQVEHSDQKIAEVSAKLDTVKNTMKSNIDKLWERDSQIEDLLEKTELLETESTTLKVNTKKLASKFWWKNFKIWVIIIVVLIVLTWLIASLICGFKFQCLTQKGGKCFHEDSRVELGGRTYGLAELRQLSECVVPHVVSARGVAVETTCALRPLRLTAEHLVRTAEGFRAAGALRVGDRLFGDVAMLRECAVVAVRPEAAVQRYFGLNCPEADSLVVAEGVLVSTFGHLHQLPAMWIKYGSKLLGLQRASRIGEAVSDIYVALLH
jgi:hypothetical protein